LLLTYYIYDITHFSLSIPLLLPWLGEVGGVVELLLELNMLSFWLVKELKTPTFSCARSTSEGRVRATGTFGPTLAAPPALGSAAMI
jgi:hypothetical protein